MLLINRWPGWFIGFAVARSRDPSIRGSLKPVFWVGWSCVGGPGVFLIGFVFTGLRGSDLGVCFANVSFLFVDSMSWTSSEISVCFFFVDFFRFLFATSVSLELDLFSNPESLSPDWFFGFALFRSISLRTSRSETIFDLVAVRSALRLRSSYAAKARLGRCFWTEVMTSEKLKPSEEVKVLMTSELRTRSSSSALRFVFVATSWLNWEMLKSRKRIIEKKIKFFYLFFIKKISILLRPSFC